MQALDRTRRIKSAGIMVGAKLGLTSKAKQQRMSVDQPIVGFLIDTMRVEPEVLVDRTGSWVEPRIEPEMAFITAWPVSLPLSMTEAGQTVDAVRIAAEIIDDRFDGYRLPAPRRRSGQHQRRRIPPRLTLPAAEP